MAFRCINAFTIESLMRRSLLKCSITKYEVIICYSILKLKLINN